MAQIQRFCTCWAKFFAEMPVAGRCWVNFFAPTGAVLRSCSDAAHLGLAAMGGFAPCEAFQRRVAGVSEAWMASFPPIGGDEVAVRGGVTPKSQTASVKNAENGLFWAKWSVIWA